MFRTISRESVSPTITLVESLKTFFEKFSTPIEPECAQFISKVQQDVKKIVSDDKNINGDGELEFTTDSIKHLRMLQRSFVFVPIDKAAHNLAIVCKKLYLDILNKELTSITQTYQDVTQTKQEIINKHQTYFKHFNIKTHDELPYLYFLPKLHKTPISFRFVAGSAKVTTTNTSKILANVLQFVLNELEKKDNVNIKLTGIRRFFVVHGYEKIANFLQSVLKSDKRRHLFTGDFSTMYTTIPHDDLKEKLGIHEAFEWGFKHTKILDTNLIIKWTSGECA